MAANPQPIIVEFDGGSRGNPGPAGIGVVVRAADGTSLLTLGRFIGRATNNVAEYTALVTALREALKLGAKRICVRGDSELVVRQMLGQYRVRHPDLVPLYHQAQDLYGQFEEAHIEHNARHRNALADKLANLAMDRRADVTDVDEPPVESAACPAQAKGDRHACPRCGCVVEVLEPSRLYPHQLKPWVCVCGARMS